MTTHNKAADPGRLNSTGNFPPSQGMPWYGWKLQRKTWLWFGKEAELVQLVVPELKAQGYRVSLEVPWGDAGRIDVIAQKPEELILIEAKLPSEAKQPRADDQASKLRLLSTGLGQLLLYQQVMEPVPEKVRWVFLMACERPEAYCLIESAARSIGVETWYWVPPGQLRT